MHGLHIHLILAVSCSKHKIGPFGVLFALVNTTIKTVNAK